jgi:crotonobetainyl-CoA:carnitine CoA-transferase CaiB-like acyl-CoA transferase
MRWPRPRYLLLVPTIVTSTYETRAECISGPFADLLLADSVLRINRAPPTPQYDPLARRKTSICVNFKSSAGISLIKELVKHADVFIDPYRPGALERLGLCPTSVLLKHNPRLIVARMTGFRRDGKYANMRDMISIISLSRESFLC